MSNFLCVVASKTCAFYDYVMFCFDNVICCVTNMKTMDFLEVDNGYMLVQTIAFPRDKVRMFEFKQPRKVCQVEKKKVVEEHELGTPS